ncbi:MAG: DNA-binding response regulator [Gammaproteobacteria bacterium MedPE]|nr:MAG: DNA-binding response regulator [Gammaproteobacteria bacterium MedPE]
MTELSSNLIVLIEDDLKLATLIQDYLQLQGLTVHHASDGKSGLTLTKEVNPQLVILDLMLPKIDGLTVCRELQKWYKNSLLILSASADNMDQVAALEMGADDYVCKPIHPRVLLARVRAHLRRHKTSVSDNSPADILTFGQLTIDLGKRQTHIDDREIKLTETEFELLWLLACNPEQPISREEISQSLRGISYDGLDRSIDNKIVSLRKKIGDNANQAKKIITVRGKGYLFVTDQWSSS